LNKVYYNMKLSIVIVHYKVPFFLMQCLQSVKDACVEISSEIIVIDNNSEDESCKLVAEKFPEVVLVSNTKNVGFSRANNQGVEIAKGDYVVILNPDTVVAEDTFLKLLAFTKKRKNIGVVGVKLIDGKGVFLPESKRGIPTPTVSFNRLFGISSKQTGKYYASHLDENESGVVEILVGAFMFMKRSIYYEVKGFDETYFMYGEDIDLSYKILKKGYQNYYFADTQVIHYKGESTSKNVKYLRHFYQAMKIFYKKHFKLNILYDFIMSFGIRFWYLLKYFQLKSTHVNTQKIKSFYFYSNNTKRYHQLIKAYNLELSTLIDCIEPEMFETKNNTFNTIVFDNNWVSNKKIITVMQQLKGNKMAFRMIPKKCNFIIGSDGSNAKGYVLKF